MSAQEILSLIENVDPSDTAKLDEEWRKINAWPYEVSNLGNIRSEKTKKLKSQYGSPKGYMRVKLCNKGIETDATVASLVAEAFHGKRPNGLTIDHIDGNKKNNCALNLEYVTQRENVARYHRRRTGDSLGVYFDGKRYNAQICVGQQKITLGWYSTEQEAISAYLAAFKMTEAFNVTSK